MPAVTPRGFRDILPTEALARERITGIVRECFSKHGYLPVETPILEDRRLLSVGSRIEDSPFQLFDADGSLLMVRPDLTLPIARMVSSRMAADDLPLRLRYSAPVVREESSLKGQPRQFTQLGIEYYGNDDGDALPEVEVVSLLAETLEALDVPAWRIVCGSVSPLKALLAHCSPSKEFKEGVLSYAHESDLVSLDDLVDSADLSEPARLALHQVPRMSGGSEVIARIDSLLQDAGVPEEERGTQELERFVSALSELDAAGRLSFDFSIVNSFDYYTGIIFKGYAEGITASIASGGRYDAVLANFGRPNVASCGFALSLERLQEILGEQGESGVVSSHVSLAERPLRIAVPKGSLFPDAVRVLGEAGLPTDKLQDLGRKLIVRDGDVEYVIVRAQDAPAFVAHGGADCGICGYDSIFEANHDLIQLVDLRFGGCRFVVAEPRSKAGAAEDAYRWRGSVRVATKYPRITQSYYDRIGQQVDIVQLHGNIELGPIVGMTDRLVDITATGTTLRENDLVIVDEVMQCTARFFAGPAAYRYDGRIRSLAARLAQAVAKD
ncbi:MAG: ATP phosphoribosyltransferase [Coriobacteriaceae bacterium]|nr:ATP phosphoribosyltransferase [Olsenella sp.]RRF88768.1 MAG: ATP phosphoribosyltransferase [Coriobacteriaceae bacterium]